jgi:beta-phosphoglucomutase
MFEAVIFDWDGTLADTRKVVVEAFQKAFREVNVKIEKEFIERRIGTGARETFKEILQAKGLSCDEETVNKLLSAKTKAEVENSRQVVLFEGALDLLNALRKHVKTALASMNNKPVIQHMLAEKNLSAYFDAVLSADDVEKPKPNPEIFLKAAEKLGTKPERCVVLEDSLFGVKAAKAARMSCIAVLTGVYTRPELETAKPDLIVESLGEKRRILNFILKQADSKDGANENGPR